MKSLIKMISTALFVGNFPFAPGTAGSLWGVLLYWLLGGNSLLFLSLLVLITIAGFMVSGKAEEIYGKKDPSYVVIDEVVGMMLTFLFIPFNLYAAFLGFILFRAFDILKFWPMSRLERLKGSAGIMLDDIAAGLFANLILQVVVRLPLNIFS